MAGRAHVLREAESSAVTASYQDNVHITQRLAQAAEAAGIPHFVFISSVAAAADRSEVPIDCQVAARPRTMHGRCKLEAEQVLSANFTGRTSVLRPPMIYGEGMRGNPLRIMSLVARGWPIPLGGLTNRRSILYAGNAAAAVLSVMQSACSSLTSYVTDDVLVSTSTLVAEMGLALGRPARLWPCPTALLRGAGRVAGWLPPSIPWPLNEAGVNGLVDSLVLDDAELRARTAYQPPFSLQQGLARTARWFTSTR
jgi:UDP-glucose 4-epimerase